MKYLALSLALLLGVLVPATGALAQEEVEEPGAAEPAEPDAPVADAPVETPDELEEELETDGEAEPEPEVSEPEPEVSEPEPEVSEPAPGTGFPGEAAPGEGGGALGSAADAPPALEPEPEVSDEAAAGDGDGEGDAPDTPSTADRLASPNPVVGGVKWAMPIVFSQSLTVRSLDEGSQTTFDPTYSWNFSARPRYIFRPNLTFGARLDTAIELTTNNFGQRYAFNDLTLDATYTLKQRPAGILFVTAGTLRLPTSELSRANRRIVQPGARLTLIRPIPVLQGLIVGGVAGYSYWANASNVSGDERPNEEDFSCSTAQSQGAELANDCPGAGTGNIEHTFSTSLFATLIPVAHLNLNLGFTTIWSRNANLAAGCLGPDTVIGAPPTGLDCDGVSVPDDSATKWNVLTSFGVSVGYDFLSYLTVSVGMSTLAFHPNTTGARIENPIFNEKSAFFLSAQFRPAGLYAERHPANEDD